MPRCAPTNIWLLIFAIVAYRSSAPDTPSLVSSKNFTEWRALAMVASCVLNAPFAIPCLRKIGERLDGEQAEVREERSAPSVARAPRSDVEM